MNGIARSMAWEQFYQRVQQASPRRQQEIIHWLLPKLRQDCCAIKTPQIIRSPLICPAPYWTYRRHFILNAIVTTRQLLSMHGLQQPQLMTAQTSQHYFLF